MALTEAGVNDIAVVDCDLSGKWGSSERNAGGVRVTWGQGVNIDLAKASISFYEKVASEVAFHQKGYLWLYSEEGWRQTEARREDQQCFGCHIEQLDAKAIRRRFPFLNRLEGVFAASFSPKDGLINPNLLKHCYRNRASGGKVDWIDRHVVEKISFESASVDGVYLRALFDEDDVKRFLTEQIISPEASRVYVKVGTLINAAGSWAPRLAMLYGGEIPSIAIRRQVSVVHSQEVDLAPYGMIVDTSGLYFHHEAGNILSGYAVPTEPSGYRFKHEGKPFFMEEIWPRLSARSSFFDRLKLIGGWAGLYAVSPDRSAIIGQVEGASNIFEAHSFSGHGVMQSYAVGRALAELIVKGAYRTIDLSPLSGDRFNKGKTVPEEMLI